MKYNARSLLGIGIWPACNTLRSIAGREIGVFFVFMPNFVSIYSRMWVIKLIKLYQKTLSFDHGFFKFLYPHGFCRFKPTCSEYAVGSIEKFGLIYGGCKAFWRVLRCNPWSAGGYDPPDDGRE